MSHRWQRVLPKLSGHWPLYVQNIESPVTYLIHFLALNGIDPSPEDVLATGGLPYKYSVGADQYVVVK